MGNVICFSDNILQSIPNFMDVFNIQDQFKESIIKKLSVIIPVYNEKNTVETILNRVQKVNLGNIEKEIIVVDDGSTDGTRDILKRYENINNIVYHSKNLGKGEALKTGFSLAVGDYVVVQDADLEYDPNDFKKMIEKVENDGAEVVYGSRRMNKNKKKNPRAGWKYYLGGVLLSTLTNLLYGTNITDEATCYKMISKKVLNRLTLESSGFELEPEITVKIARLGIKIEEVPISYNPRSRKDGKKIKLKDGIIAIYILFKYRLNPVFFKSRVFSFLKIKKNSFLVLIIILGFLLRIIYLSYTNYETRTYDVGGHIDYIQYILKNYSLPTADKCWQCYQPPIYYILAALFLSGLSLVNIPNIFLCLQFLSLIYFLLFLFIGIKFFKQINLNSILINTAMALLVFWPSGIIHSVRIGNDVLLYLWFIAGLYFILKWFINEKKSDFYFILFFSALATLTKSNGLILLAIFASVVFYKFLKNLKKEKKYLKNCLIFFIFLSILLPIAFYRPITAYYKNNSQRKDLFVGNISSLNGGLFVNNKLSNYLWFDLKTFTKEPFTYSWEDKGGRQYYWNFLLKSSLFGEFEFNKNKYNVIFGKYMSWLLMTMLGYFIVIIIFLIFNKNFKKLNKDFFFVAFFAIINFLLFSVMIRIKLPVGGLSDFRYVFPMIVPAIMVYILGVNNFKECKNNIFEYIGYFLALTMVILSILFFIVPVLK